jgi:hypothetical protein
MFEALREQRLGGAVFPMPGRQQRCRRIEVILRKRANLEPIHGSTIAESLKGTATKVAIVVALAGAVVLLIPLPVACPHRLHPG